MNITFEELVQRLRHAGTALDVFGPLTPGSEASLQRRYHALLHIAHPDHNGNRAEANEAFRLLQRWYTSALREVAAGTYGEDRVVFTTGRATYSAVASALRGELCDLYDAEAGGTRLVLKVVGHPRNNDLVEAEAKALRLIGQALEAQPVRAHFPTLVDTFTLNVAGASHQVNALQYADQFVTLADVIRAYPRGVSPQHAGWIFNRVLAALGSAHDLGLVHGAVVPTHVLVRPRDHNGLLLDWCYSVSTGKPLRALSPAYRGGYPPEVLARQPATPATDLFLAAQTMTRVLGGTAGIESLPGEVPRAMKVLLQACLIPSPHRRYRSAWQVFDDWRELLHRQYGPPAFRTFDMPAMAQ